MSANRDAALSLAKLGLHIFPCNPDKTPTVAAWEQTATNNALQIEARWQGAPQLIPGIPVGAHGLVVIDADRKPNGPDGVAAFDSLCTDRAVDLSRAFVVETPSGGLHFYWRTDTPYGNSSGSLPNGVDVRGVGGFVVGPGATLPDGRSYRIVNGTWDAIPALPEPLAALLRPKEPPASSRDPTAATERERSYAERALADEVEELSAMREGEGRNAALNAAAKRMGEMAGAGWIDAATVECALWDAAERNGYRAKDGNSAASATLHSGLEAGLKAPRALLPVVSVPEWLPRVIASWIEAFKAKRVQAVRTQAGKSAVTLVPFSRIEAKAVNWLWRGFIPQGKLVLLAGAGGTGKSTLAFSFASTVSNAGLWPDGFRCAAHGNVLIWSSEDDPSDTIGPRLMAVGANLNRCFFIQGPKDDEGIGRSFDPASDMNQLRDTTEQAGGVSLLIIDPIVNAVVGDMNKANEVRRSLQTFVDFAAEMNCAVLGITHFTKGSAGKNAAERVLGSGAFKDFSRMTLVAAKDEESNQRVFTRAKSNISEDTGGFNYGIEAVQLSNGIIATRIVWGEPIEGSSRSILARVEGDGNEDGEKMQAAKRFLIQVLSNGPTPAKELVRHASEGYGIKEDTLRRAFTALSGMITRSGFGKGSVSMWALPIASMQQC